MIILLFKITGYFTLTENIAITRALKVVIRTAMTAWIFYLYYQVKTRNRVASFTKENTLAPFFYGLYLFMGFMSLLYSTNPGYSLLQLVMNIESFVFAWKYIQTFILARHCYPNHGFRLGRLTAPAIFMIQLAFIIGKYVAPDQFFRLTHGGEVARLGGYLMNPNELGMLAVVGIACCIMELAEGASRWKNLGMLLVILYALVLTGSRSSMIGFMLILFYFINKSDSAKLKMAVYVAGILAIPVIVQTIFIKQGDIEEVLSMTGRLPFWKALLTEGLPKEPWFGFGYMRIAYTEAFQSVHTYAGKMTHNTFIQVLMNLGFVGFFIVLLQMTFTVRAFTLSKNKTDKAYFTGLFIPILINSFTEFGIFGETNYGILFWQLLTWLFVFEYNPRLSLRERALQQEKRR